MLGDMDVNVPCPSCKKEFKMKIREIENNRKVKCPHCQKTITLKVKGDDLKKPDRELKRLQEKLKEIGDIRLDI
jgi:predicted Zn finger-like uncharacterized protein